MAVNALAFLLTLPMADGAEDRYARAVRAVDLAAETWPEARVSAQAVDAVPAAMRWQVEDLEGVPQGAPGEDELDGLVREVGAAVQAHPVWRFGYRSAEPSLWTAFTSLWTHGGWFHLLGNLLFAYLLGMVVEDLWGRARFAGLYVAAGLAGVVGWHLLGGAGEVPMVGASGAIMGLMGAFLVTQPRAKTSSASDSGSNRQMPPPLSRRTPRGVSTWLWI